MNNSNIKKLLYEYERKRENKLFEASQRKKDIYTKVPRLQEIDNILSKYAISTSKSLLSNYSKELLDNLNLKISDLKKEKEKLLKDLNIDDSYFLPHFDCPICKDSGYVTNAYESSMCSCLKQRLFDLEYNTLNVYNMKNQTFDSFSSTVYSDKVDKSKYNSDISPRKNIEIIKNICLNFIENFENISEKNLLFTGNSGLGKTFLSSCIANSLLKRGKTVLYQTAPVMLDSIINQRLRKN